MDELVKDAMRNFLYSTENERIFDVLQVRISRCIVKHVTEYVLVKATVIPSSFRFSEAAATAHKRADLEAKLEGLQAAGVAIAYIDLAFVCDNWGDNVVTALLKNTQATMDPELSIPDDISDQTTALYEEHVPASLSYANARAAHLQAYLEQLPLSPSASDLD